jgi:hypothetical protein
VVEEHDLRRASTVSVLTFGLDGDRDEGGGEALFCGHADRDRIAIYQRPGLHGPGAEWRLVAGVERRGPHAEGDAQARRVAAWLELQSYWRWLLQECVEPEPLRAADLCVKLVAEPVRILLWLVHGERTFGRVEALERGMQLLPDEGPAISAALELHGGLHLSPRAPLAEFLPSLVRLSSRVGACMAEQVAPAGSSQVRLAWDPEGEPVLSARARARLSRFLEADWDGRIVPLADWRALALPEPPDEALAPLAGSPTDPSLLARAALAGNSGPYPALRADGLLVLASHRYPRSGLRAVQCAVTDPVSFALLAGESTATFPEVTGWSARDWARRAVAENRAWLRSRTDRAVDAGQDLARLLSAARAGLFLASVEAGDPELALTAAAVAERLRGSADGAASVADEAAANYRQLVLEGTAPATRTVDALGELVLGIGAYAGVDPGRQARR